MTVLTVAYPKRYVVKNKLAGSRRLLRSCTPKAEGLFTEQSTQGVAFISDLQVMQTVAYPGILFREGSTNSVEDRGQRERGSGGGSPVVRGSGGGCNLVQEISFHIVNFS
jgi:hypothetical protein